MREIKYRAWLKNGKWMEDVVEINFYDKTISYIEDDYINTEQRWIEEAFENIVLMQSTGLHDKNGTETYEGDILRLHNGKIRTVFRVKGGFAIESLDMDVGKYGKIFCCPINSLVDEQNAGYIEDQSEVIGNIYNNPELLESEGN